MMFGLSGEWWRMTLACLHSQMLLGLTSSLILALLREAQTRTFSDVPLGLGPHADLCQG